MAGRRVVHVLVHDDRSAPSARHHTLLAFVPSLRKESSQRPRLARGDRRNSTGGLLSARFDLSVSLRRSIRALLQSHGLQVRTQTIAVRERSSRRDADQPEESLAANRPNGSTSTTDA